MRTLSAVIGDSLSIDVGRALIIALSVLVATGFVRGVWSWLMRTARDDFRESIGVVVDEKLGDLQTSLSTMADDLGALASALKDERQERHDLRDLIDGALEDLTRAHLERKDLRESIEGLRKDHAELREAVSVAQTTTHATVDRHDRWLITIGESLGLDLEDGTVES